MNSSTQSHDYAADEQAALWAARLDGSSLAAADRAALDAWLKQDPAHAALLAAYRDFSADLEEAVPALAAAGAVPMPAKPAARRHWSSAWLTGGLLAGAAAVALGVWAMLPQTHVVSSGLAERQSHTLEDGTRVELNAHTHLVFENSRTERRIRLADGEAFFAVRKDPSRPFIVATPGGSVRVTGTSFNVRAPSNSELEVTVAEGSVHVQPAPDRTSAPVALAVGDRLSVSAKGVTLKTLSRSDLEDVLAWRHGQIVFDDVPLSEALARFGHYHGRSLTPTPAAAARHIGGRFSLDDLDGFLSGLETTQGMHVTRDADGNARLKLRDER